LEVLRRNPHLKSFLQGYWVHCLADELDLTGIMGRKFPLNLRENQLSPPQCTLILELFNISRERPVRVTVSGSHNPILNELGVGAEHVAVFAQAIQQYLSLPSLSSLVSLYQTLGLACDDRLEKYRLAGVQFQRNWFQRNLIYLGLQVGKINQDIKSIMYQLSLPR